MGRGRKSRSSSTARTAASTAPPSRAASPSAARLAMLHALQLTPRTRTKRAQSTVLSPHAARADAHPRDGVRPQLTPQPATVYGFTVRGRIVDGFAGQTPHHARPQSRFHARAPNLRSGCGPRATFYVPPWRVGYIAIIGGWGPRAVLKHVNTYFSNFTDLLYA